MLTTRTYINITITCYNNAFVTETHPHMQKLKPSSKARFPLPEFTGRVHGPRTRVHFLTPELTARVDGCQTQLGCQKMHQTSRAINSTCELGPWTRVVETGLNSLGKSLASELSLLIQSNTVLCNMRNTATGSILKSFHGSWTIWTLHCSHFIGLQCTEKITIFTTNNTNNGFTML